MALDFLVDEPKTAKEVKLVGREAGHSWATLRRAKDALRVVSVKNGLTAVGLGPCLLAKRIPEGAQTRLTTKMMSTFEER